MKIAFITGCARSGTSIIGELIASHSDVNYVFEEGVWKKLVNKINGSHVVSIQDITPEKKNKLRTWMACYKKGDKLIVEKNPRHIVRLPLIKSIFPEAKIIHIVRDGRDVSCSLKSGLCGKTWAHVKPPRWKKLEQSYDGIIRCAWAYRDIMEIAIKDLSKISHLQIKYEDLIENPEKVAIKILKYLELQPSDKVTDFCKKIQNNTTDSYQAKHQTRWQTNDHSIRINRWKENISDNELVEVNSILGPVLKHFGYS